MNLESCRKELDRVRAENEQLRKLNKILNEELIKLRKEEDED